MSRDAVRKVVLAALLIAVAMVLRIYVLGDLLSLAFVKESQQRFVSLYADHGVAVIAAYMAMYISVTALSLPGATVMSLAGGAIFGLWRGTVIISFASSIGATLACFGSRYILRDWVQKKFGDRLSVIDRGIAEEGAFYLFTLRLIPVFPFFMINLLMGLTKIPLRTFYWVSQLGMLAGTIVYVNAGQELGKIDSLSGILSPGLIISFTLLGLFPVCTKKLFDWYRKKRQRQKAV
ncbi:MAG: TVP38/TMEM64 family protein [Nitrospirae bacterium]|nr:TVP38/TMEM64 family protein [Nitrospirota bacterium]